MLETALGVTAAIWGVVMAVSPALQIRKMLQHRSSREVSVAYFCVLLVGFVLWIAYGISIENWYLIVPNAVAFIVARRRSRSRSASASGLPRRPADARRPGRLRRLGPVDPPRPRRAGLRGDGRCPLGPNTGHCDRRRRRELRDPDQRAGRHGRHRRRDPDQHPCRGHGGGTGTRSARVRREAADGRPRRRRAACVRGARPALRDGQVALSPGRRAHGRDRTEPRAWATSPGSGRRVSGGGTTHDVDAVWILAPHDLSIAIEVLGFLPAPKSAVAVDWTGRPRGSSAFSETAWHALEVSARSPERRREVRSFARKAWRSCPAGIATTSSSQPPPRAGAAADLDRAPAPARAARVRRASFGWPASAEQRPRRRRHRQSDLRAARARGALRMTLARAQSSFQRTTTVPPSSAPCRSALAQTVQDLEVLVVGDGVPAVTREVMDELTRSDSRVRFFDNPKGPRHGELHRHAALQDARGEIVCYLADDDLWRPGHVEEMRRLLAEADFAHSLPFWIDADGGLHHLRIDLGLAYYRELLLGGENRIPLSCGAHTMALYERLPAGWRTTPEDTFTDLYMWQQILAVEGCRAVSGTCPPRSTSQASPVRAGARSSGSRSSMRGPSGRTSVSCWSTRWSPRPRARRSCLDARGRAARRLRRLRGGRSRPRGALEADRRDGRPGSRPRLRALGTGSGAGVPLVVRHVAPA